MQAISMDELVAAIAATGGEARHIIALAGPPGAGKSTLAEALEAGLNALEAGSAAILPMDGYHLDDRVLVPRGLRPRKGAPETFDVAGFSHMLERLRANREDEIAVPVFDRDIEIARAGARMIPRSVRRLIVEGNYLLLDREPWRSLRFDTTVMIAADEAVLHQRLIDRWREHQLSAAEIAAKVEGNDMVNVRLVMAESRPADYLVRS